MKNPLRKISKIIWEGCSEDCWTLVGAIAFIWLIFGFLITPFYAVYKLADLIAK